MQAPLEESLVESHSPLKMSQASEGRSPRKEVEPVGQKKEEDKCVIF